MSIPSSRLTFCLPALLICAISACTSTPRPLLDSPQSAIDCMRTAYQTDDASLFIHALAAPVMGQVSDHTLRIGWPRIRPLVGDLVKDARVVEVHDFRAPVQEPLPPDPFVRPSSTADLRRVVLEVAGQREDFLFQRETDPPPPTSRQAPGFFIGDRYIVKNEHPTPEVYLVDDSPAEERTHWRLVFPYEPFQREGAISRLLQERLAAEK